MEGELLGCPCEMGRIGYTCCFLFLVSAMQCYMRTMWLERGFECLAVIKSSQEDVWSSNDKTQEEAGHSRLPSETT